MRLPRHKRIARRLLLLSQEIIKRNYSRKYSGAWKKTIKEHPNHEKSIMKWKKKVVGAEKTNKEIVFMSLVLDVSLLPIPPLSRDSLTVGSTALIDLFVVPIHRQKTWMDAWRGARRRCDDKQWKEIRKAMFRRLAPDEMHSKWLFNLRLRQNINRSN